MKNIYHSKVMNSLEEKRKKLEALFEERKREVYENVPKMVEVEKSFARGSQLFMSLAIKGQGINENFMTEFHQKQLKLKTIKKTTLIEAGYPEDYLDLKYDCSKCSDTGYIGANQCSCYENELRNIYYKESNIGSVIGIQQLSAFFMEDYETKALDRGIISDYDKVQRLEKYFIEKSQSKEPTNLYIVGGAYEDRRQIGMFITQKVIESGRSAIYIPTEHLIKIFNEWRFNRKNVSPEIKNLKESLDVVDYLILDSLGDEQSNSLTAPELFELINKRMFTNKSTIITTRLTIRECSEIYSDRLVSRIMGIAELIKIPNRKNNFFEED